jgi:hypothetical protein
MNSTGAIDLEIFHLPLLEGVYDLTVDLVDWTELHSYDHWGKRKQIHVVQTNVYDEGLITTDASWKKSEK